ncbi:MFS transporter [Candidatus Microgenomates bacterium]|nr:MFS transporter [Candidatus Microgenomates bacterium]
MMRKKISSQKSEFSQILSTRPFLFLWLAQIFSQLAFNMVNFILILQVFELTSSNTVVSGLVVSFTLPAIIFGLLAGAYVDKRNKKAILLLTNIARAVLTILFMSGQQNLWAIFLLSFLIAGATQFFIPAEASSIPRVVGEKLLLSANSLFTLTLYASILVGYIVAGPVLKLLGFNNAFLFSGMLYFIAAFFVSFLPSLGKERDVQVNDFLRNDTLGRVIIEVRTVYKLIKKAKKILFAIAFLTVSQVIVVVLATILPGFAKTILGIGVTDISLVILAPATLGMIIGSIFLVRFGKNWRPNLLVNAGIIVSGIILFLLPRLGGDLLFLVIFLLFLLGLANALVVVVSNATLQTDTASEMLGKVYGVFVALSAAVAFLPIILAGGLADLLGIKTVFTIISLSIIALGLYKGYRDYAF